MSVMVVTNRERNVLMKSEILQLAAMTGKAERGSIIVLGADCSVFGHSFQRDSTGVPAKNSFGEK